MFLVPVASCLEGRLDELRIFVRQPSRPSVQLPQFGLNKTYIAKSAAVFDASSYKPGVTVVNFGLLSSIGRLSSCHPFFVLATGLSGALERA
jgi:hypothetical protein